MQKKKHYLEMQGHTETHTYAWKQTRRAAAKIKTLNNHDRDDEKTKEFQTQLLYYFSKSNTSSHHHMGWLRLVGSIEL